VLKLPAESSTWVELPPSGLFQLLADLGCVGGRGNVGVAGGGNGAGEVVPLVTVQAAGHAGVNLRRPGRGALGARRGVRRPDDSTARQLLADRTAHSGQQPQFGVDGIEVAHRR
jgi:hypothetical protein